MATKRQLDAARTTIKQAQTASRKKRTLAHLPERTRHELGKQGALGRKRHGESGHALEDRNRQQLYELAQKHDIAGRSTMDRSALITAIRKVQ
jgi:hypothetical protein